MGITGSRGACPACRAALWAPESDLVAQPRCPRCGANLWMLALSPGPVFFLRREDESLGDLLMALGGSKLAAGAGDMESALRGADRLDAIELLWEVEEALRDRGY